MSDQASNQGPPRPSYSMMDMGDLSPLFPSGSYNTESSMRSTIAAQLPDTQPTDIVVRVPRTLSVDSHNTINPENLVKVPVPTLETSFGADEDENDTIAQASRDQSHQTSPATSPTWNAINAARSPLRALRSDADTFAQSAGYGMVADVSFRMKEILSLSEDEVDTSRALPIDDSDDDVYHINHQRHPTRDRHDGASYSVVFDKDDPDDVSLHVHLYFQQKRAKETQAEREEKVPYLEEVVRFVLLNGAKLLVEKVGEVAAPKGAIQCIMPRCPYETDPMPTGKFFLSLRPGEVGWQYHRNFLFCLDCFENMWDCKYNAGQWPPASIEPSSEDKDDGGMGVLYRAARADSVIDPLDGSVDADTHEQFPPLTPQAYTPAPSRHEPFVPDSSSTPGSINSDGEWLHPPVRTQAIAEYFIPRPRMSGHALDFGLHRKDAAKVNLWKAVSKEQTSWDEHMKRTRIIRAGGELPVERKVVPSQSEPLDWGDGMMDDVEVEEEVDIEVLEDMAGLEKWQCYGNRLGDVLRL